jgi:hypothetical protein
MDVQDMIGQSVQYFEWPDLLLLSNNARLTDS